MTELKVYLCNSQQIDALRDRIQQLSGDLEDLQKRYDLLEGRFGRVQLKSLLHGSSSSE